MAEQPRKRAKTSKGKEKATSIAQQRLETWFLKQKLRQDYLTFHTSKEVMRPHFIDLEWYNKAGFTFGREFSNQGLTKLVSMKGLYYPELVSLLYLSQSE